MLKIRNQGAALRRLMLSTFLLMGCVANAATTTVVELDRGEPFEAMAVNAGHLWVGQSRTNFNGDYRVQVFDAAGTKVGEAKLKHAVSYLYAHGASEVLAVGTAAEPNLTHFSVLSLVGGKIQTKTTEIPEHAWAHQWVGTVAGAELFIDFSGSSDDPEADQNFNLAHRTVFAVSGKRATYLPMRIAAPVSGKQVGGLVYLIRAYSLGQPATNIVLVDTAKKQSRDLFAQPLNRARDFVALDGGKTLAVSVQGDNALRYFDATNGKSLGEVSIEGGPSSLAVLGQCVLVGAEGEKEVLAVRRNAEGKAAVVSRVDFSGTGALFRGLRKIAVNPATGTVYGRSAYACNPLAEDCSVLWNSVSATDAETSAGLLKACQ